MLRPQYLGPLFSIKFHRVVLDEASEIKNHETTSESGLTRMVL
jgi:SNF2 family DNA or RNA helicase